MEALGVEAKTGNKIFRAAMRQASNEIMKAARAKAPVLTGNLSRKIQTASVRGKPGTIRFQVRSVVRAKPTARDPKGFPYSAAVERGHGFPRTRKRLHGKDRDTEFGSSQVPAYPFMRPAWNEKKEAAVDRFVSEAGHRIEELAKES